VAAASAGDLAACRRGWLPLAASWSLPRRILFRLGFVYWQLFCVPNWVNEVPFNR
jgi:hypothetical protein